MTRRRRWPVWNVAGSVVGWKPTRRAAAKETRRIGGVSPYTTGDLAVKGASR